MKSKLFLAFVMAACLGLSACSEGPVNGTGSHPVSQEDTSMSEPDTELPTEEGPTEEELEGLFSSAIHEINKLATEDPCDYIKHIFGVVEVDQKDYVMVDELPYARTSLNYHELVEYYADIFVDEPLEWILSTKFVKVEDMVYCGMVGGQTGGNIELLSISKLQENTYQAVFQYYYGPDQAEERSSVFEIKETDAGYRISSIDYRPASLK